jgi:hypothetical protein
MTKTDPRRYKRFERKAGASDPLYLAWLEGQAAAYYGKHMPPRLQRNPYPLGRRHDTWQQGYDLADPLGDHHGRNV